MKTTLYDNNVSAYLHQVMNDVVGKPDFGEHWDADKVIDVDQVPEAYRGVVKQAAGEAKAQQQTSRRRFGKVTTFLSEDKSFASTHRPTPSPATSDRRRRHPRHRRAAQRLSEGPDGARLIEPIQSERGD